MAWAVTAALLGLPLVLLLVLLLALAVPVGLTFDLHGVEPLQGSLRVRWLFGLVHVGVRLPSGGAPPSDAVAARVPTPPRRAGRRRQRGAGRVLGLLRDVELRRRALRLLADLISALHLRDLKLHARVGLGDPADTGRLWGLLGPVGALAGQVRRAELRLEPDFDAAVFAFDTQGRCHLVPLHLIALVLAFGVSRPARRAWRHLARVDG